MEILKTGVIYDPGLMQHKARRKHPETPLRVKVIIDMLESKKYLSHPKIDYLPSIHRLALQNELTLAHQQKYVNFCQKIWPKSGHRSDITILDTYFNQKSQSVARMASGGLLTAIDHLVEGHWENGFAVIRPPGHHSGAKNTVNGFCIYNNVAIGANYLLQKHKKKKVAILDWDVHHGDGTQYIMQKNKQVLFISIHRHDRGTFYPAGEDGHFTNNGQEEAKGTKVNIPLSFVDETFRVYNFQSPGDNEYIYLMHRLVLPLLRDFDPDFIIISSGFDAAFGDPLGGFTVTPNCYHYMTKKVLQIGKPTLVALEGGYNLNSIKVSAEGVVRALLNQDPPKQWEDYKGNPLKQELLPQLCQINEIIWQQIDAIVEFHSQYWPCLTTEELKFYTDKVKNNSERVFSIIEDEPSSDQSKSQDQTQDIDEFHNESRVRLFENNDQPENCITQEAKKAAQKGQRQGYNDSNIREMQEKQIAKINIKQESQNKVGVDSKKQKGKKKNKERDNKQENNDEEEEDVTTQFYFAAGHMQRFKNFSLKNQKIHKWAYQPQINFFESNFQEKEFAPSYYGREGNYIIIENLLFQQKNPIVMDIKLSRQSKNPFISEEKKEKEKRKEEKSTADKLAFRISGYTTAEFKEGGIMTYSEQEVRDILRVVVDSNNKKIFSDYLQQMSDCLVGVKRKYWGTSIVLIKGETCSRIKWIDFHYYICDAQEPDSDLLEGLKNLRELINSIQ